MWEGVIVAGIVLGAALYLVRRYLRTTASGSACAACGCCDAAKPKQHECCNSGSCKGAE